MTRLVIIENKEPAEIISVQFPFADQLLFGETITDQVCQVSVAAGVDPAPSAILLGVATLSGTTVSQRLAGGVKGVVYQVTAACTGSSGNLYTKVGRVAVVNLATAYIGA